MAVSLERARAVPLTVHLTLGRNPRGLDLLMPHIGSIETLHAEGFSTLGELNRALPDFPRSTPDIQSLTLAKSGQVSQAESAEPFESSAHTLRHLTLRNIPLYPSFLRLRTLTQFSLTNYDLNLPLDSLLKFLKENPSLGDVHSDFRFAGLGFRCSENQEPIKTCIRSSRVSSHNPTDTEAFISRLALPRGAHLDICSYNENVGLNLILSDNSVTHLRNLSSPVFMNYIDDHGDISIQLQGSDGSFHFRGFANPLGRFAELALFPLRSIQELYLKYRMYKLSVPGILFPSYFPSLETLAIDGCPRLSHLLSIFFSDPASNPDILGPCYHQTVPEDVEAVRIRSPDYDLYAAPSRHHRHHSN